MRRHRGFTLVELLVVLTIIATLLSIAVPRYSGSVDRAKEATLRENLATMRDAIDKYHADRNVYPGTLEELAAQKYLRKVPLDPVTDSTTSWILVPAESGSGIMDVKSGAQGEARDGSQYRAW